MSETFKTFGAGRMHTELNGLLRDVEVRSREAYREASLSVLPPHQQVLMLADLAALQYRMGHEEAFQQTLGRIQKFTGSLPTNQFGVRNGFGRLIHLYLQLYRSSGLADYLNAATCLADKQIANKFILHKAVGDHSLYRGEAGWLLNLLSAASGKEGEVYLAHGENIANSLLRNAWLSPHGIQWPPVTDGRKSLIGFGYGSSGVAYALCAILDGEEGRRILTSIFAQQDSLFNEDSATWPDFRDQNKENLYGHYGFENGAAGIAWVRLRAYRLYQDSGLLQKPLAVAESLRKLIGEGGSDADLSFPHGLAGYGYLFAELHQATQDMQWQDEAVMIAEKIALRLQKTESTPADLQQAGSHIEAALFLADFWSEQKGSDKMISLLPQVSAPDLRKQRVFTAALPAFEELTETWLSGDFAVTTGMLKEVEGEKYRKLLHAAVPDLFQELKKLVKHCGNEDIQHQYSREKFVFTLKRQADYTRLAEEELSIAENTEPLLSLPDEDFEQLNASHFPFLLIDGYEEATATDKKFTEETFGEFLFSYGNRSYLYRLFPEGEVRIFSVGVYKILLDAFADPRPVREGLEEALSLFKNQESHVLAVFSQYLEEELGVRFESEEEIFQTVRTMLYQKIKEFVLDGILMVQ